MSAAPDSQRWVGYDRMAAHVAPAAEHLIELLGSPTAQRRQLLDLGSGSGTSLPVASAAGWLPIGLDRAWPQLRIGSVHQRPQILADAVRLPVRTSSLDACLSNFALIFVSDPDALIGEVARCLRPGMPFVWTSWTPGGWPDPWRAIMAEALGSPATEFPVELGVAEAAEGAMRAGGFVDVSIERRSVTWLAADAADAVDVITSAAGGLKSLRTELEELLLWGDVAERLAVDAADRSRPVHDGIAIDDDYLAVAGWRS